MKFHRTTAVLLALSLLLTGCGSTSANNTDTSTNTSESVIDAAEPETEPPLNITSPAEEASTEKVTTSTAVTTTSQSATAAAATNAPQSTTEQQTNENSDDNETPQNYYSEPAQQQSYEPVVTAAVYTVTTMRTTAKATTTTTTTTKALTPSEVLDGMTLEQKVCQMFMVTPEAITGISPMVEVGNGTKNAMAQYPVGGVIYFSQNLVSKNQVMTMINNTQSYSRTACGIGLFIGVDEEGGKVARCAQKLGTTSFKSMESYGKDNNYNTAYDIGSTLAKDLKSLGFNVDFAPVADVNINPCNELGDRIFSSDPNVVANMVCGVSKGLEDNGVCSTLKHFPGLGAESGNTHTNSTVLIDRTVDELRNTEFVPFKKAIDSGADFVMVGHMSVTGFGDELPCDLSYKAVTEMLRGELGFKGLAITDAQQMHTISQVYTSGEAAKMSIKAGIDIILMPVDYRAAVDEVCEAVRSGEITEKRIDESVMRILEKKEELGLLK